MKNKLFTTFIFLSLFINDCISQNIWEPTNGPNGVDISAITITPDNTIVIFAKNLGMFISKDKGLSWEKINKGLHSLSSDYKLTSSKETIYATTGGFVYHLVENSDTWINYPAIFGDPGTDIYSNDQGYLYVFTNHPPAVYFSIDNGYSYGAFQTTQGFEVIRGVSMNGDNNNFIQLTDIFYTTHLYKVTDDGTDLLKILRVENYSALYEWHPDGYLFFLTDMGIARIDKDGMNRLDITSIPYKVNRLVINKKGEVMAFTEEGDYVSKDLGESFNKTNTQLYKVINEKSKIYFLDDEVCIYTIVNSTNTNCTRGYLYKTMDGGLNWSTLNNVVGGPIAKNIFIDKGGRIFASTCQNGAYVYSLDKGKSWKGMNYPTPQPVSELVSTRSGNLFLLIESKLFKSNDLGNSWDELTLFGNQQIDALKGNQDNTVYAFSYNNVAFVSKDGGVNWSPATLPSSLPIKNMYFDINGNVYAIASDDILDQDIIYFTEDDGKSWAQRNMRAGRISSMCISKSGYSFIATLNGDLYRSQNKFQTAEKLISNGSFIQYLAIDSKGYLYATDFSECRRSRDNGNTWVFIDNGEFPGYRSSSIAMDEQNYLYISFRNGEVYKTINPVSGRYETEKEKLPSDDDSFRGGSDKIQFILNQKTENQLIQPNPASNEIRIMTQHDKTIPILYKLYDIAGYIILEGEIKSRNAIIEIESVPNGIYLLKFDQSKLPVQKIIIQH